MEAQKTGFKSMSTNDLRKMHAYWVGVSRLIDEHIGSSWDYLKQGATEMPSTPEVLDTHARLYHVCYGSSTPRGVLLGTCASDVVWIGANNRQAIYEQVAELVTADNRPAGLTSDLMERIKANSYYIRPRLCDVDTNMHGFAEFLDDQHILMTAYTPPGYTLTGKELLYQRRCIDVIVRVAHEAEKELKERDNERA